MKSSVPQKKTKSATVTIERETILAAMGVLDSAELTTPVQAARTVIDHAAAELADVLHAHGDTSDLDLHNAVFRIAERLKASSAMVAALVESEGPRKAKRGKAKVVS